MSTRPGDRHVLHPGDKVMADIYRLQGIVLARFILTNGEIYHVVEHKVEKGAGVPCIYADKNLELVERGFEGAREDSAEMEIAQLRAALEAAGEALSLVPEMRACLHEAWFSSHEDTPSAASAEYEAKAIENTASDALAEVRDALGSTNAIPAASPL